MLFRSIIALLLLIKQNNEPVGRERERGEGRGKEGGEGEGEGEREKGREGETERGRGRVRGSLTGYLTTLDVFLWKSLYIK